MRAAQFRLVLSWLLFAAGYVAVFTLAEPRGRWLCGAAIMVRFLFFSGRGLPSWSQQSMVAALALFIADAAGSVIAFMLPVSLPVLEWLVGIPLLLVVLNAEWRVFRLAGMPVPPAPRSTS